MNKVSGAIATKCKCIYGKSLCQTDYEAILQKNTVTSVVLVLKSTERYKDYFGVVSSDDVHRGQIEEILGKSVFETYNRLCRFASINNDSFFAFFIKRSEINQILNAMMFIGSKSKDAYVRSMPTYLLEHASFDLMQLAKSGSYSALLIAIEGTPYHKILKEIIKDKADKDVDLEEAGTALLTYYVKWCFGAIKKSASGRGQKELMEAVLRQVETDNVLLAYRMKTYFNCGVDEIKKALTPYYFKISKNLLNEALQSPKANEELIKILNTKYFKNTVIYDSDNLEIALRKINYDYYRKKIMLSQNGILVFYSLMMLLEAERENVTTIIEGVRYSLPRAEIEKLLTGINIKNKPETG